MKNTLQNVLLLLILFVSISASGQENYEIHSSTVSEKFNSENELQSRHIWATGVQAEEILNIDMTVDVNNKIKELIINDKTILPVMAKEYKAITDYVIAYVDGNVQTAPTDGSSTTTKEPAAEDKMTDSDRRALMSLIKAELIKDELIDNPNVFDFMLTFDSLYINAKKQEDAVFTKYKALYDKHSDIPISKITYFQMTQTL